MPPAPQSRSGGKISRHNWSPKGFGAWPGVMYFAVALGSGIGGVARLGCSEIAVLLFGDAFPWGILAINVLGSLIIGFYFTYTGPDGRLMVSQVTRQFVMTGLCGGYTTFSAFSLDTLNLIHSGRLSAAGANVSLSVVLCLLAVWMGHALATRLSRPTR